MANKSKAQPGDLNKEELIKLLQQAGLKGWSVNSFTKSLERFCKDYDLPYNFFFIPKGQDYDNRVNSPTQHKNVEEDPFHSQFLLMKAWKELFMLMVTTYKDDPFIYSSFDKSLLTMEKMQKYYQAIIDKVNDGGMAKEQRHEIINSSAYIRMCIEKMLADKISEKFAEFQAASSMIHTNSRKELWIELYLHLDALIYRAYQIDQDEKRRFNDYMLSNIKNDVTELQTKYAHILEDPSLTPEQVDQHLRNTPEGILLGLKKESLLQDYKENEQTANFSQYLAKKLNVKLTRSMEAADIIHNLSDNDLNGGNFLFEPAQRELLDMIDIIRNYHKKRQTDFEGCGNESYENFFQTKNQILIDEATDNINQISHMFDTFLSMKGSVEECLENMNLQIPPPDGMDTESKEYYEGFLRFYEQVVQKAKRHASSD